ncbi:MAG: helix-turn-helix transcriptional regulator [Candidatus Nomurabacteria bacterium]|nr:helix-turn-helix transcriptional regulator [Candidatus Nomurabacteria bacterium]
MTNYIKLKNEILKDPKVKEAYNNLELEFSIVRQIIDKRSKRGISQKDLAKKIGTGQSAISRLESGRYNPSLSFLKKISEALGSKLEVKI